MLGGRLFSAAPHFDQAPGRAKLLHRFHPSDRATMRRGFCQDA
jgi:hypothetical protein